MTTSWNSVSDATTAWSPITDATTSWTSTADATTSWNEAGLSNTDAYVHIGYVVPGYVVSTAAWTRVPAHTTIWT